MSSYAEYRGAKYRFKRTEISENLLDGLGVLENTDSPADKGKGKEEATFPGYRAKETSDGVMDYRPGLRPSVEKLEAITDSTFAEAVTSLVLLDLEARANPGKWIDGKIMLGANPQEYLPSDEELLAAEFGDRLATYVESRDILELIELWDGEALLPFPLKYNRFEYRHADVMGSGRFFYASNPIPTVIAE